MIAAAAEARATVYLRSKYDSFVIIITPFPCFCLRLRMCNRCVKRRAIVEMI